MQVFASFYLSMYRDIIRKEMYFSQGKSSDVIWNVFSPRKLHFVELFTESHYLYIYKYMGEKGCP